MTEVENKPKEVKAPKTAQQVRDEMLQRSLELEEKATEVFKKTNVLYKKIEKEIKDLKTENISFLKVITKKFNDQMDILRQVVKVSQATEDTLLNVHLSIKQNEYLQAYYPAQHGYPEMKVIGAHPAKTHPLPSNQ